MATRVPVTFAPAGVTASVAPGTTVAEAARDAGMLLSTPCAGRGVCAGCGVRVVSGALADADDVEARSLKRAPAGVRLACRARVIEPVVVRPLYAAASESSESAGASGQGRQSPHLVAGVDLGTTSVAALIIDPNSGKEVARASTANRQSGFGADVLSRISAALAGKGVELQALADASVVEALSAAAASGQVDTHSITRVIVAGNTAMAALLVGADVSGLAAHPFVAAVGGDPLPEASGIHSLVAHNADVALVPPMASFVGGDALAGAIASGLVDVESPTLLMDLGTNAELVLAVPGRLYVASTAAGPAFEGVGISCGGPAAPGAIDSVRFADGVVSLHVIEDALPGWFSGAGLLSAIVMLREMGHIAPDGSLQTEGPLSARFSRDTQGVLGVRISADGASSVVLTQLDVRAIQLAKAAVRAGLEVLLRHARVAVSQVDEVLVAGAFGAALKPSDLVAIGVLPGDMSGRIRHVGNAALTGAAEMALDTRLLDLAARTAEQCEHVDLALDREFNGRFVAATEFPAWVL